LGILTSCRHKRELFAASRNSNNLELINYKRYSKISSALIKEAKKLNYADKIKKIPEQEQNYLEYSKLRNKSGNTEKINTLNIHGNSISDRQEIADAFNKYFLTIAKGINLLPYSMEQNPS
jgi:hypothetical protein